MKTSLKLVLAGLVLLTQGFGQEPKQALAKQVATPESRKETIVTGAQQTAAPVVQPNVQQNDSAQQKDADNAEQK
jgi:hypothetical protein